MSNKTNHFSKILAIFIFIITILILIVATTFSIYFGGQKKVVTNFFNSIQRQNEELYSNSVVSLQEGIDLYNNYSEEWNDKFGEEYKVRCDFVTRKSSNQYVVDLLVYNDSLCNKTENLVINLKRTNGKWKVDLNQPPYTE